jgi:hypothetical protein
VILWESPLIPAGWGGLLRDIPRGCGSLSPNQVPAAGYLRQIAEKISEIDPKCTAEMKAAVV